jgi:hypothetical protein
LNGRKKFGPNYKVGLFTPQNQIVIKLSKIKVSDPGSGKNIFREPNPGYGVEKASDPGSATLV